MLEQLHIEDFAVARSVDLKLTPGLTVFTGETGAGKSLVVDALAFAFGARRGREVIAAGAAQASVRVSWTGPSCHTLERSVAKSGRTAGRLDGEPATVEELLAAGARHIDIHGQSEQLAILRPAEQLRMLDQFAGLAPRRQQLGTLVGELRAIRKKRADLSADQRERERLVGQLTYETEEISSAGLQPGEDEVLRGEATRLANAGRLQEAAAMIVESLSNAGLGQVINAAYDIIARDDGATAIRDASANLEAAADDLLRAARAYQDTLEEDPGRLAEVQERLDLIARLRRKYGDTIADILAYHAAASARLSATLGAETSLAALDAREEELIASLTSLAGEVSRLRRLAANRLVGLVQQELEGLGMLRSSLAIGFSCSDDHEGVPMAAPDFELINGQWEPADSPAGELATRRFTETGVDRVEFFASFNAGETPRPLGAVASGGETSRFLLALTTVLSSALEPRTIVFDEVDEGVGGRAGSLVGAALARLSERHQVLCITHLPQVAAYAANHFAVAKQTDGARTWSTITALTPEERVVELAEMLGGDTAATRAAARDLLDAATTPVRQAPGPRRRGPEGELAAVNERPRR